MRTVYCLQHSEYHDRRTGVTFEGITPFKVREETDDFGRTTVYRAHSKAQVPDHLVEHYQGLSHIYHVAEGQQGGESGTGEPGEYRAVYRTGPWWDVVDADEEIVNKKALREDDARELADELNAGGDVPDEQESD